MLGQRYPGLEYIVMDDGSTDGSSDILSKYSKHFSQYVKGPNRGFGAVLHDGLTRCTGEIMAWLNSDDLYLPGTLHTVAEIFRDCPEVDWLVGSSLRCDDESRVIETTAVEGFSRTLFFSGRYLGGHPNWNGRWVPQESVFWRRSLWEKAGGYFLKERLQYGDFELWTRFWQHADLHALPLPLAVYRIHQATYTSRQGDDSVPHCTRLLESAKCERLAPWKIKLLSTLSRAGNRPQRWFGQPAQVVRWNFDSKRWSTATSRVS